MGKYLFSISGQSNAGMIYPYLRDALIARYGTDTRVVLSARGNTPISQFVKNATLYNDLLDKVQAAQSEGYTWAKHYYWQGEADTLPGLPELWESSFVQMIINLRNDSGAFPQIIFFKIGLPPNPDNPDWYALQDAQEKTRKDHPGFLMIPTNLPNYPTVAIPHRSERSYSVLASWAMALIP
jgi:hypothetical protein